MGESAAEDLLNGRDNRNALLSMSARPHAVFVRSHAIRGPLFKGTPLRASEVGYIRDLLLLVKADFPVFDEVENQVASNYHRVLHCDRSFPITTGALTGFCD